MSLLSLPATLIVTLTRISKGLFEGKARIFVYQLQGRLNMIMQMDHVRVKYIWMKYAWVKYVGQIHMDEIHMGQISNTYGSNTWVKYVGQIPGTSTRGSHMGHIWVTYTWVTYGSHTRGSPTRGSPTRGSHSRGSYVYRVYGPLPDYTCMSD